MLSQTVHIPELFHGNSEFVKSSLIRLARTVETSRIHELVRTGDEFTKGEFRFSVVNPKNVRINYGRGGAAKEFYLLFSMSADAPEVEGEGKPEHLLVHFGTINGTEEECGKDAWFSEMVVVDTEFSRKTFSDELERESAILGGDAPKTDAVRLAAFALASVVQEYSEDESLLAGILDRTRDSMENVVSRTVQ